MRINEVVREVTSRLRGVSDIPQKEAMLLLSHHLKCELSWLMAHDDVLADVSDAFWFDVTRRTAHEPLEYILGVASFYGKIFIVDKRVLIPRPETEILVDKAVDLIQRIRHPRIVEIGCGSGIISIMLALLLPDAMITAVDLSLDALHVAKQNADKHGVSERITFVQGSYLDGVEGAIDMVVSNPPYIAHDAPLGEGLSFEPSLALFGGERGDEMLLQIIDLCRERKVAKLVCEMGYDQKEAIHGYAIARGLNPIFYTDLAGLDRGFWIEERECAV